MFAAGTTRANLTFMIQDDDDDFEYVESFVHSLRDPAMQGVDVSATTTIQIMDDDGIIIIV